MRSQNKLPVIIGSGISGMMISRTLTKNKIHHILIGKPALNDNPVLGEAMNEVASLFIREFYTEFRAYFHKKRGDTFFMGEYAGVADFTEPFLGAIYEHFKSRKLEDNYLFHLDRTGFESALYAAVSGSNYVMCPDTPVEDIDYDKQKDRITRLHFRNGASVEPSYVFDATDQMRFLGRKLALPCKQYDERIVFSARYISTNTNNEDISYDGSGEPWMHATNILFATEKHDGLDGVACAIPFGKKYISVGISMRPEDAGRRSETEIISVLYKAYENRGMRLTDFYPVQEKIRSTPSHHFMYEKVYGKNWVLAGGAACQMWAPPWSDTGASVFLSKIAAEITDPSQSHLGLLYEKNIRAFEYGQHFLDDFIRSKRTSLDIWTFFARVYETARKRFAAYCLYGNGEESRRIAEEELRQKTKFFAAGGKFSFGAVRAHCPELKEQTQTVYEKLQAFLTERNEHAGASGNIV